MDSQKPKIVRVGTDSFATMYVWYGLNLELKIANDPKHSEEIRKEYHEMVMLICLINYLPDNLFKMARPIKYYSSLAQFKVETGMDEANQEILKDHSDDCSLFATERLVPVPPKLRSLIQEKWLTEDQKDDKKPFFCGIYLGKNVGTDPNPNPLYFPLDASRLTQLEINVDNNHIAYQMGRCLSIIHLKAKHDASGVKFILGGQGLCNPSFFCINFNQMRRWINPSELVNSFYANEHYCPQPGTDYWHRFKLGYLSEAAEDISTAMEVLKLIAAHPR